MGGRSSKISSGGTLQGAFAPAIAAIPEENLPSLNRVRTYRTTVPSSVKGTSNGLIKMSIMIGGKSISVQIPKGLKSGDTFTITKTEPEYEKIITSTLHMVPGMEIVQAKPIIWASVSYSFYSGDTDQQSMGNKVGELMQNAQDQIIKQVLHGRCNACLGMSINITNDSSGESGNQKLVIVTATGTPCVVVPSTTALAVDANVVVEPLYG